MVAQRRFSRRQLCKALAGSGLLSTFSQPADRQGSAQTRCSCRLPNNLPPPKFWFGDRVRVSWLCDDRIDLERLGKVLWMEGFITGLVFDSPDILSDFGWAYQVNFDKCCDLVFPVPEVTLQSEGWLTPASSLV